ncbi:MAG TPA: hypothetical protein DCS93_11865 [Microscillaceae bacterium]|nr:hypothetical protein [Microscillaceae bacterium]
MEYTITIGEAMMKSYENLEIIEVAANIHQTTFEDGQLPDFLNNLSQKQFSETLWKQFVYFINIPAFTDLFYDIHKGWLRLNPRVKLITSRNKKIIDKTYEVFKTRYPDSIPVRDITFDTNFKNLPENYFLGRLEWLKYWVDWSLENCEKPVFQLN